MSETAKIEMLKIKTGRKLDENNYSMELAVGKRAGESQRKTKPAQI